MGVGLIKKLSILILGFGLSFSLSVNALNNPPSSLTCPTDYFKATSKKYIFIGEDHRDYKPVYFFQEILPLLKKQGFNYFFAEYIDSHNQSLVDDYQKYGDFTEKYCPLFSDWGYDFFKYVEITSDAHKSGLNILGLDRRHDLTHMFPGEKRMAIRDQHMFDLVFNFIEKNPDAKLIFFNGSSHSYLNRHLSSPNFYEFFVSSFDPKDILNIKFDYFDGSNTSLQRLNLNAISTDKFKLNCPSRSFLFKDPKSSDFNFYLFKDGEKAFPPQSPSGLLVR